MPTVYVVTSGQYSAYTVHAIYSSKEKAQAAIDLSGRRLYYEIEEFDLDPPNNDKSDKDKAYYISLYISKVADVMDKTDVNTASIGLGGWVDSWATNEHHFYAWTEWKSEIGTRLLGYRFWCCVVADSEERAIKVANERRIMAVANGELAAWERKLNINQP